jgi:hypothetical protein
MFPGKRPADSGCRLEEVEPPQRRELVQHEQQPMTSRPNAKLFGQPPADLVEYQTYERLGTANVGGRQHAAHERLDAAGPAPLSRTRPYLPPG